MPQVRSVTYLSGSDPPLLAQKCYLCSRYVLSPMCPVPTQNNSRALGDDFRTAEMGGEFAKNYLHTLSILDR